MSKTLQVRRLEPQPAAWREKLEALPQQLQWIVHVLDHVTQRYVPVVRLAQCEVVQAAKMHVAPCRAGSVHGSRIVVDALGRPSEVPCEFQERTAAAADIEKPGVFSRGAADVARIAHIEIAPASRQEPRQDVAAGKRVGVRGAMPAVQISVGDPAPEARECRLRGTARVRVIALVGKTDRGSVRARIEVAAPAIAASVKSPFTRSTFECVVLQFLVQGSPRPAAAKRAGGDSFKAGRGPFFESV